MVVVPAVTPLAIPVVEPILAVPGKLLVQVPPAVKSDKVVLLPVHTELAPVMPTGLGFTVTIWVT